MGRAVLRLEACADPRAHRETVLDACRQDQRWEGLEDGRAPFLFDALHATGEPEWYAGPLRDALFSDDPTFDVDDRVQVFALCTLLARGGLDGLRPVLEAAFVRGAARGEDIGAEELVRLGGLDAYALVCRTFAAHPPSDAADEDRRTETNLLDDFAERCGGDAALRAHLSGLVAREPSLGPYLDGVRRAREANEARWAEERKRFAEESPGSDEEDRKTQAATPGNHRAARIRRMRDDTFRAIAADFLTESDPKRLRAYLQLFRWRPFPLDPARLIELAHGDPEDASRLAISALNALRRVRHPDVRAACLRAAATPGEEWRAADLLVANPGPDDATLFADLAARPADFTDWGYHRLGLGLNDYAEAHPAADLAPALTLLYKHDPCSRCRGHAVENLIARSALPEWMRRECVYDADSGTRKAVMKG